MTRIARHISAVWRDETGAVLVELAIVLGLFVLLVFGLIDFGRLGFSNVLAEKATERAVRLAVVRAPLCEDVPTRVNRSLVGTLMLHVPNGTRCSDTPSVCAAPEAVSCTGNAEHPQSAAIWSQIQPLLPVNTAPENLRYSYSFDPELNRVGAAYAPVVTVEITDLDYHFISPLGAFAALAGAPAGTLGASFPFPSMSASLPSEDLK